MTSALCICEALSHIDFPLTASMAMNTFITSLVIIHHRNESVVYSIHHGITGIVGTTEDKQERRPTKQSTGVSFSVCWFEKPTPASAPDSRTAHPHR